MKMAIDFEEETKGLDEYFDVFKRRKKQFLVPALIILAVACLGALLWPSTYQSSATILIEEQQIPRDLVASTITSFAAQQIEVIKARIMTSKNIIDLVERYNLYTQDELKTTARSALVSEFIDKVGLDVLSAGVLDPRTGKPTEATIAFTLSYKHASPEKAQKVTGELVNLYLNENLKDRTAKTSSTSNFLQEESAALAEELEKLEVKLAEFKLKNEGSLPELYQYNLQVMERTEREALDIALRLKELEKRQLELESQLVQLSPYAPTVMPDGQPVLSDYDRLKSLKSEYRQKVAVYSLDHPDVIRIKREIGVLESDLGVSLAPEEYMEQYRTEQNKLSELEQKYTVDHPKYIAQQRVVDQMQIEGAPEEGFFGRISAAESPDNPAYILLETQLKAGEVEIQILKENKMELDKKLKKYEEHILKAPMVEKTYFAMQRDHANATAKYQEINAKARAAEIGQNLEQSRKGERFTLIDPPQLPEEPVSPNRVAIIFLGFIFAIGVGIGTVIIAESLAPVIRGKAAVARIMGVQPLVVVPYMPMDEKTQTASNRKYVISGAVISVILVVLACVHFFGTPLDVLLYKILRNEFGVIL